MLAPPFDDPTGIGLSAFLVDTGADVATIAALVPGAEARTFDEVLDEDDDEALDALADRDVIAVVPGGAGPALRERARRATRKVQDVASAARAVCWASWNADAPFSPPKGIDTPGSFLAWVGSLPALDAPLPQAVDRPAAPDNGAVLEWREPRPVRHDLPSVPALTPDMIPPALRGWLADIAERIGCPLDFPAVGAVIVLAVIVGRKVTIRPKRHDDWTVVPNLWGAVVGRPGVMKTPALTEATKPLRRLESEARKQHEGEVSEHEARVLVAEAKHAAARHAMKTAAKKGDGEDDLMRLAEDITTNVPPPAPALHRYSTTDPTVESLGEILRDNPNGVGLIRDELTGWLRTFDRAGREGDRAFYLEAWNGNGLDFTVDRIGRGRIFIPNPTVSVLGGIQPSPLRGLVRGTAKGEQGDDGLLSRFQLLVWPDVSTKWRNVDRWPDTAAKNRAFEVFQALDAMTAETAGASLDDGDGTLPFLRFVSEAQERFDAWRATLEAKIRAEDIHPLVETHLSKYRSLLPSLALLFHLADVADGAAAGPVTGCATMMAERWCEYLEAHAVRAYACITEPDMEAARTLSEKIKEGALPSPFALRDVYRKCWSELDNPDAARRAVAALEDLGWVQVVEKMDTGGRPREEIHIHPSRPRKGEKNADSRPDPPDKADKRVSDDCRKGLLSVLSVPPRAHIEKYPTPETPAPGWRVRV